jgi:hypothetical protein
MRRIVAAIVGKHVALFSKKLVIIICLEGVRVQDNLDLLHEKDGDIPEDFEVPVDVFG